MTKSINDLMFNFCLLWRLFAVTGFRRPIYVLTKTGTSTATTTETAETEGNNNDGSISIKHE